MEESPPKLKDFAELLDDAGVAYPKKACLEELEQFCVEHCLVAPPPVVAPGDVASTSTPSGPPKLKADFARLLDDAGVAYPKKACLEELKKLCVDNGLVAPPPVVAPGDIASTSTPSGPPKLKADFARLLDDAGVAYPKKANLEEIKK